MRAKMNSYKCWTRETRPDALNAKYKNLLLDSGFKIVDERYHFFSPFGFTAIYVLSESHFAIHTFPEENTTYLELTSCTEGPFRAFLEKIQKDEVYNESVGGSDGSVTFYAE